MLIAATYFMSCGRRDVGCGEASCADEEWVSSRSQAPILNPTREMWGSTKQQPMSRTTSQQSRQIGCSSCGTSIADYCQDRSTSQRIRTRKATKIKRVALLPLLLACLCQCASSSSISPMLHSTCPSKTAERRKKKNNTGFYYGIRDEHISCSSTSSPLRTLTSLRPPPSSWKPAVQGLTSKLQSVPYQISLLARERVEWVQDIQKRNQQTMKKNLSDETVEHYPSPQCQHEQQQQQQSVISERLSKRLPTMLQKIDWHISNEVRQSLLQNLSQSMQSVASQHWYDRVDTTNNVAGREEAILEKVICLIGGSMPQHDQDIAVVVATKSKRKKKKKRQNNTGFYFGLREDVFILPKEEGRTGNEKSATTNDRRVVTPPSRQKEKGKSSSQEEQRSKMIQKGHQRPSPKLKSSNNNKKKKKKKKSTSREGISSEMSNILGETMLELREMREEIISLREELHAVKKRLREEGGGQQQLGRQPFDSEVDMEGFTQEEEEAEQESSPEKGIRSRKRDFDRISKEVEKWACNLLFEEERTGNGWKEISCNNMMRKKFNKDGRTQVYLKWMADSRDEQDRESSVSDKADSLDYPCIKCYSTIDAPMETVCSFLSDEETIPIYNELVVDHDDIEEITPHSKITWTKMPKVLFVKSRDFVTFCSHRWWRDGTQVIVNQACEHNDRPGVMVEGQGDATRGFALRGANCEYIYRTLFLFLILRCMSGFMLLLYSHLLDTIFSHLQGSE